MCAGPFLYKWFLEGSILVQPLNQTQTKEPPLQTQGKELPLQTLTGHQQVQESLLTYVDRETDRRRDGDRFFLRRSLSKAGLDGT